ncbi:MAG TPA: NAD(P)/FAD-dependent oxidoreductase [Bacteroidales bacterium]|nr:NAD(P)/FAD-dependent oxidoreductase [Bacteroidales bacterium]
MEKKHIKTVVIGAGQSGLAVAYYLKKNNEEFVLLDSRENVGNSWRERWDSLRLFTPSQYDGLPGFKYPAARGTLPAKEEIADYLSRYAKKFSLPIELNTKVLELNNTEDDYEIITSKGKIYANNVVVATGTNPSPYIPSFASELNENIVQIHSSKYKNPHSFPASNTLVVGAGTSGVEIAVELSKTRPTMLSGKPTPHIPDFIFRYFGRLYWLFAYYVLTVKTPIGRKVKSIVTTSGGPLISVSMNEVKEAKVEQLPRLKGVENGLPLLENGHIVSVSSIIWATGFKPDFSWIKFDVTGENGWPKTNRGIAEEFEGLYFAGMIFQFGLTSGLVGGVGRDAAFVVNHLHKRYKK